MSDAATLIVAIIVAVLTYTGSVIAAVIWLERRFKQMEENFRATLKEIEREVRKEMQSHHDEDDDRFLHYATRIQRLEIAIWGFTESP